MKVSDKMTTRFAMLAMLVAGSVAAPALAAAPADSAKLWITAVRKHELVKDLKAEELALFVGKEEQTIQGLSFNPPVPLNVGLVIDISGSRRTILPGADTELAPDFFRRLLIKPGDQVFIVA